MLSGEMGLLGSRECSKDAMLWFWGEGWRTLVVVDRRTACPGFSRI